MGHGYFYKWIVRTAKTLGIMGLSWAEVWVELSKWKQWGFGVLDQLIVRIAEEVGIKVVPWARVKVELSKQWQWDLGILDQWIVRIVEAMGIVGLSWAWLDKIFWCNGNKWALIAMGRVFEAEAMYISNGIGKFRIAIVNREKRFCCTMKTLEMWLGICWGLEGRW